MFNLNNIVLSVQNLDIEGRKSHLIFTKKIRNSKYFANYEDLKFNTTQSVSEFLCNKNFKIFKSFDFLTIK